MTDLSKHETLLLIHDKLLSIRNCVDECERHDNWDAKTLRHELAQVMKLAKRALKIIEDFEPADETVRVDEVGK